MMFIKAHAESTNSRGASETRVAQRSNRNEDRAYTDWAVRAGQRQFGMNASQARNIVNNNVQARSRRANRNNYVASITRRG